MKKNLFILFLLLSCIFCYANDKENRTGFSVIAGDTYVYSKAYSANLNSFNFAIGCFNSDEDGLFDVVNSHYLGFNKGSVMNKDVEYDYKDYGVIRFTDDTKYHNIYLKDLYGVQANVLCFSFGAIIGTKIGVEWMSSDGFAGKFNCNYSFKEFDIYGNFVPQVYFSLNILKFLKLSLTVDCDLPIIKFRMSKDSYDAKDIGDLPPNINWYFFEGDIPMTYSVGLTFFF